MLKQYFLELVPSETGNANLNGTTSPLNIEKKIKEKTVSWLSIMCIKTMMVRLQKHVEYRNKVEGENAYKEKKMGPVIQKKHILYHLFSCRKFRMGWLY